MRFFAFLPNSQLTWLSLNSVPTPCQSLFVEFSFGNFIEVYLAYIEFTDLCSSVTLDTYIPPCSCDLTVLEGCPPPPAIPGSMELPATSGKHYHFAVLRLSYKWTPVYVGLSVCLLSLCTT